MPTDTGIDGASAMDLNLTPEEKRAFGQLFRQADTDTVGVVTGEVAVKFFEKTKLDSRILGEIWQIADSENRGFLTPAGFSSVLRLIGHAQAGREPTSELASQPGPLPQFEGFQLPSSGPHHGSPTTALLPQGTGGPLRIPPLTPEKATHYSSLFERQSLQPGGLLAGDQAKQIFEKSGLPNEVLGRVWQLADTEQRGALVQTEFIIAMHLLMSMKSGSLRNLPPILPAPLYEAASRRTAAPRQSPANTGPASAIPKQMSGSASMRTGSPLGRTPIPVQATSAAPTDWLVSANDKARFDQLFGDLDKSHKGFITGEEAVPFLSQSSLPEDVLAQIWDLADIKSEGCLTRDTFAVAMYLIRQQRTRRDGSVALPSTLPPNLIPPSLRAQTRPPIASPFDPAPKAASPPPAPKSALEDLFSLDTSSGSATPQRQAAQITGDSNDPFASTSSNQAPSSPTKPGSPVTTFKPFVPSSSFGRGLTVQATGDSSGSGPNVSGAPLASDDLLGDNDPEISNKLTNETTELANLSNQVSSLSKQMSEVQNQRTATQTEFNQASAQKRNFEQRLEQLRSMYEKEVGDVQTLQKQLKTARNETRALQAECMQLDTTYKDLQSQHQQVVANLDADRQENAALKEKIRTLNADISSTKSQMEKLKSEARQQKGLVAIHKKQVLTNEGERDKLQGEMADIVKSNGQALSRQGTGSSLAATGGIASPAGSTASGNNPFFKRTGSTDIMGVFSPPSIKSSATDQTFDDIFGPSKATNEAPGNIPSTASPFHPQSTGASVGSGESSVTASGNVNHKKALATDASTSAEFRPFSDGESVSSSPATPPPVLPQAERADASALAPALLSKSPAGEPAERVPAAGSPNVPDKDLDSNSIPKDFNPFAATDDDKAKADFENAFASFSKAHKPSTSSKAEASKIAAPFDSEFPPISELERDDDDSDSDTDGRGFDDDFAPSSSNKATDANESPQAKSAQAPPIEQPSIETTGPGSTQTPGLDASPVGPQAQPASQAEALEQPSQPTNPPKPAKDAFDDFDDFEGLEDAKEGSADDDFQSISRSGLDDFTPVFDGSPPTSQAKSDLTAPFGQESSYGFGSTSVTAAAPNSNPGSAPPTKGTAVAESTDWDAIFATLDAPSELSPKPQSSSPAAAPAAGTEDGKDDDPILKNLTGMGYARADALLALEKYDYNLERAANHLASQS